MVASQWQRLEHIWYALSGRNSIDASDQKSCTIALYHEQNAAVLFAIFKANCNTSIFHRLDVRRLVKLFR